METPFVTVGSVVGSVEEPHNWVISESLRALRSATEVIVGVLASIAAAGCASSSSAAKARKARLIPSA